MGQPEQRYRGNARIENTGKEMNTRNNTKKDIRRGHMQGHMEGYKKRQTEGHTDKSPFYPTLEDSNDEKGIRIRDDIKPTQMLQNIS